MIARYRIFFPLFAFSRAHMFIWQGHVSDMFPHFVLWRENEKEWGRWGERVVHFIITRSLCFINGFCTREILKHMEWSLCGVGGLLSSLIQEPRVFLHLIKHPNICWLNHLIAESRRNAEIRHTAEFESSTPFRTRHSSRSFLTRLIRFRCRVGLDF